MYCLFEKTENKQKEARFGKNDVFIVSSSTNTVS